ncbi:MAG TPA: type II toxin-antitoxin system Phd/YefM family antitoxin [Chloroflexia bacterium]|nr:type II toxin-antitoxin system Phd/YefM family antitoxin [Chloroflexia bacterium]
MTPMSTGEARDNFADVINRVAYGKERVVLTRRGKRLVAVVPIEDVLLLEKLEDQIDIEEAHIALEEARNGETVSWEQIKSDLNL